MFAEPLDENEVVFFEFNFPDNHSFWNKNVDFGLSLAFLDNGVLGSVAPAEPAPVETSNPVSDKVLIHSERSVSWSGVGNVIWGLNLVSKKQADQWLTRDHVRLATTDEAAEFSK